MNELDEKQPVFEIALVLSKNEEDEDKYEPLQILVDELKKTGLLAEIVPGLAHDFIKLAAPLEALAKAAAELQIRKRTSNGMDLAFDWDQVKAFARQADGSLFSWCERHHCYNHLIYGIVNKSKIVVPLTYGSKKFYWEPWEPLLRRLETEDILKEVFPLHGTKNPVFAEHGSKMRFRSRSQVRLRYRGNGNDAFVAGQVTVIAEVK